MALCTSGRPVDRLGLRRRNSDAGLVVAARTGDRAALAQLIGRHRPMVLAMCRRVVGSSQLAEDAVQVACLQAMLGIDSLREPQRFGPWLVGIALNVCRHLLRQPSTDSFSALELSGGWSTTALAAPEPSPEDLAESADIATRVRGAVLRLPPGQRSAVIGFYLSGLTYRETAAELDAHWSEQLAQWTSALSVGRVRVMRGDLLSVRLPSRPYRVLGCPPFAQTTALLRHLLDDPTPHLQRVDLVIQWEVAIKRASSPPTTLLSTRWAPWWKFRLGPRVPATQFRPVPRVDAGLLTIMTRDPPLLPVAMAQPYANFVERHWPFGATTRR